MSSHLSPYSLLPSSPFPHTRMWWRTCWSGACILLNLFDSQDWVCDVWICTLIYILIVYRNIRNSCVKILHSHAIESLVFMNLASILKEFYIIFVWGLFYEFDYVCIDICMMYITTIFDATFRTIYFTFHMSNLS